MDLTVFINIAFTVGVSTTYGWGEIRCGDIGHARPCSKGAITSSGEVFDPELPTAAVAAPSGLRFSPVNVWMRIGKGPCKQIRINDKLNPRYIGIQGFDLSPRSLEILTGYRSPEWKGRVTQCYGESNEKTRINPRTSKSYSASRTLPENRRGVRRRDEISENERSIS